MNQTSQIEQIEESIMIEIQNVTKKYKDFAAVDDISLSVKKGEVFAFLGPNGAGKTTTIKMLTTLTKPTEGRVMIDGIDVQADSHSVRKKIGIVFQDPSLDNELTAWENMELHAVLFKVAKSERHNRIEMLLQLVELWDKKDLFVKNFSGGMKRRLEIARGLLHRPEVLFLDEPTIGLDPQTRNHLWEYIRRLNQEEQVTVFFTTHHMDEVERIATQIAIIDNGQIIACGTPAEIKAKTETNDLETAFIELTGRGIRAERGDVGLNQMRASNKMRS